VALRGGTSLRSLWYIVLLSLAGLVLVTAVATGLSSVRVGRAVNLVNRTAVPAQSVSAEVTSAYVAQGTGELGYVLTGNQTFLALYQGGATQIAGLQAELANILRSDPHGLALLAAVKSAGVAWQADAAAQNQIRSQPRVGSQQIILLAFHGKQSFDAVLGALTSLSGYTRDLTKRETAEIRSARNNSDAIIAIAVIAVLGLIVVSLLVMRHSVERPMARLLNQVRGVAAGTYDDPIDVSGPSEVATIAAAVEQMRSKLADNTEQLVATESELAVRDERDRLSADLHDLTVQRVLGIGLALRSLSEQRPEVAGELDEVITDADTAIRELRGVIYGISRSSSDQTPRNQIAALVHDAGRSLGFEPSLVIDGPVDRVPTGEMIEELTATLREALSNCARHAEATAVEVNVTITRDRLRLTVRDNGTGIGLAPVLGNGIANMHRRAERLGGSADVHAADGGGTVVEWHVPLAHLQPASAPVAESPQVCSP
jgi:signal transduction histidine kinase